MSYTATANTIRAQLKLARDRGLDTATLLAELDLHGVDLADPEARVPRADIARMYRLLIDRTGDPTFGLQVGALGRWGSVPEYYAASSATLGEAFRRAQTVAHLVTDAVDVAVEIGDEQVRVAAVPRPDALPAGTEPIVERQFHDAWTAVFLSFGRAITGVDWDPDQVCFVHQRPDNTGPYERLFRAELRFGCARNQIAFDRALLDLPVLHHDTELGQILEAHCAALLDRIPRTESVATRVRRVLTQAIPAGESELPAVARRLGMSARTLQRRLAKEDTTHQQLVDEIRQQLAHRFLAERRMAISETAALLGYSDPRAFHRAFRRWTGQTPQRYRQAALTA